MGRYERIILLFSGLLVAFFVLLIVRMTFNKNELFSDSKNNQTSTIGINDVIREQTGIKQRLSNLEKGTVKSQPGHKAQDADPIQQIADRTVSETLSKENIDVKSVWSATNKPAIFIVTLKLDKEPFPNTLFVCTGSGILSAQAYKLDGNNLAVIMQESKEEFLGTNDFINVRYISKE